MWYEQVLRRMPHPPGPWLRTRGQWAYTVGRLGATAAALRGSGWLGAARVVPGLILDRLDFGGWLLFERLAFSVFAVGAFWSLVYLFVQLDRDAWGRSATGAARRRP